VSENASGAGEGGTQAHGEPNRPGPPSDATRPEYGEPDVTPPEFGDPDAPPTEYGEPDTPPTEYGEPPVTPAPYEASTMQPAGNPAATGAVAQGLQMKRRNPAAVWLGLPLITLGIYHFVWYYKIHVEMQDFDRRRRVPTVGPVLVLILLSWTVIAPLISYYRTGERIVESQRAAGIPITCVPVIGMLLTFVFGLNTLYYQVELNKVVDAYGGKATPPGTVVPLRA
jgi:Domain of unknown function (DUF4234)